MAVKGIHDFNLLYTQSTNLEAWDKGIKPSALEEKWKIFFFHKPAVWNLEKGCFSPSQGA